MNLQKLCARKIWCSLILCTEYVSANPSNGSPEDELLRSRELGCVPGDATYPYSAMHVYAQNVYCDEWNEYMLDRLDGDMVMCIAKDSRKDTSTNMANIMISDKPRDTGEFATYITPKNWH